MKNTRETGDIGEKLAVKYLKGQGFDILETNYLKKWGELDIVAKNKGIIHFVEVKTYSYESKKLLEYAVSHESWRPEEQVTDRKVHQIEKALETWLSENKWKGKYVVDVVAVRIVPEENYSTVNYIEKITKGIDYIV